MSDTNLIEPDSRTWRAVKAWAEQRLAQYRRIVEAPGMPPTDTENARGAIRELKLLLDQPEQQDRVTPTDSNDGRVGRGTNGAAQGRAAQQEARR